MKRELPPRRKHRSRGELISTFTYGIVGVLFAGETQVIWADGETLKAMVMGLFSVLCIAGAFRFHIHNLWHVIRSLLP